MSDEEKQVTTDILFVGMTRPATVWGIPYTAFVLEIMAPTLVFLAVGNPIYLLLIVPIHAILYLVSAHDPTVFDSMYLWLRTMARSRNRSYWRACTFNPLPSKPWKNK